MTNFYENMNGKWMNLGKAICVCCTKPATYRIVPFGKSAIICCKKHKDEIMRVTQVNKG